jgi:hypothetical protein
MIQSRRSLPSIAMPAHAASRPFPMEPPNREVRWTPDVQRGHLLNCSTCIVTRERGSQRLGGAGPRISCVLTEYGLTVL